MRKLSKNVLACFVALALMCTVLTGIVFATGETAGGTDPYFMQSDTVRVTPKVLPQAGQAGAWFEEKVAPYELSTNQEGGSVTLKGNFAKNTRFNFGYHIPVRNIGTADFDTLRFTITEVGVDSPRSFDVVQTNRDATYGAVDTYARYGEQVTERKVTHGSFSAIYGATNPTDFSFTNGVVKSSDYWNNGEAPTAVVADLSTAFSGALSNFADQYTVTVTFEDLKSTDATRPAKIYVRRIGNDQDLTWGPFYDITNVYNGTPIATGVAWQPITLPELTTPNADLTKQYFLSGKPQDSALELQELSSNAFTPDKAGNYEITYVVNDGTNVLSKRFYVSVVLTEASYDELFEESTSVKVEVNQQLPDIFTPQNHALKLSTNQEGGNIRLKKQFAGNFDMRFRVAAETPVSVKDSLNGQVFKGDYQKLTFKFQDVNNAENYFEVICKSLYDGVDHNHNSITATVRYQGKEIGMWNWPTEDGVDQNKGTIMHGSFQSEYGSGAEYSWLFYDNATKEIRVNEDTKVLVADLDNPKHFVGTQFAGFSEGYTVGITFEELCEEAKQENTTRPAKMYIEEINSQMTLGDKPTEIAIDRNFQVASKAIVGKKYSIPFGEVSTLFNDLEIKKIYVTENEVKTEVTDTKQFSPTAAGNLTVLYETTGGDFTLTIPVVEEKDVSVKINTPSKSVGVGVEVIVEKPLIVSNLDLVAGTTKLTKTEYRIENGEYQDITETLKFTPDKTGKYIVRFTATDYMGNSYTAEQEITVNDMTKPVFQSDFELKGGKQGEEYTIEMPSATDNYSKATVTIVSVKDSEGNEVAITDGKFTPEGYGEYTVTFKAVDEAGNEVNLVKTIQVEKDSSWAIWLTIGIIAGVVILGAAGFLTFYFLKKKKTASEK